MTARTSVPRPCQVGFDATFVQLGARDLTRDVASWQGELDVLQSLRVRTIVLQYSGDEAGSYDARTAGVTPVRALLTAAEAHGMQVYVGLYAEPDWPEQFDVAARLPAPLADARGSAWLRELSQSSKAFAGFYLPHEIDEQTWANEARAPQVAAFLERAAGELRRIAPGKPLAIAPFYAETQPPAKYAHFWQTVLAHRPVDILMLQDGAGARGTSNATLVNMLAALRPVLDQKHIELWSVVEVFKQSAGPPVNDAEFAAEPADYKRVRASMIAQRQWVQRLIAFSVLDYMHPSRSPAQRALYQAYLAGCER